MRARQSVFAPDAMALLRRLAPHIDDSLLEEIAAADYGANANANLAALRSLRNDFRVPDAAWIPCEVLELIRWSRPDTPGWRPGGEGERGHWMRAFACCALLLICGNADQDRLVSVNEVIGPLVASLLMLEVDMWPELGGFLEWFAGTACAVAKSEEDAFTGVALILAAAHAGRTQRRSIDELIGWTERREYEEWTSCEEVRWLFRTTVHKLADDTWSLILKAILASDIAVHFPAPLREKIAEDLQ